MRAFSRRTGPATVLRAGTGAVAIAVGACALAGPARADTAGAAGATDRAAVTAASTAASTAYGPGRPGQVCRRGEVRPVAGLTAQALVCLTFDHGSWVGSGQLVLRATRAVSGAYSWGPRYYPVRPSGFDTGTFALRAGQTVTYPLRGTSAAEPADTGADWQVWVGVQNGIRAVGFEAQVISPVAARRPAPDQASRFSRVTPWTCTTRRVSGQGLAGVATLCVRQVRGTLQSRTTLTYTSGDVVDVGLGLSIDGAAVTTQTVPVAAASHGRRTVTLPSSTVQARRQDHRVATFVNVGTPVLSRSVAVR